MSTRLKGMTRAEAMQMVTAEAAQRKQQHQDAEDAAEELYWQEYDAMRPRPAQWVLLLSLVAFMFTLAFYAEQADRAHTTAAKHHAAQTTAHKAHRPTKGTRHHV